MKLVKVVLVERPKGLPSKSCFRLEETDIPQVLNGEILVQLKWLSLDPYMRG